MQIDWPAEFGNWLDDLDKKAGSGDKHAEQILILVAAALKHLEDLDAPPTWDTETATLKWVRQSKRYPSGVYRTHTEKVSRYVSSAGFRRIPTPSWLLSSRPTKPKWATSSTAPSEAVPTPTSTSGNGKWKGNDEHQDD